MPDDLDTLSSLVSELQRTGERVYGPWQAPFVYADGYLRTARDWLHMPSAQQVRRLPSEADLRALVDSSTRRTPPTARTLKLGLGRHPGCQAGDPCYLK